MTILRLKQATVGEVTIYDDDGTMIMIMIIYANNFSDAVTLGRSKASLVSIAYRITRFVAVGGYLVAAAAAAA